MRQKWKNGFWPFWHQFWFGLLQWLQTCILVVSKPHWRIQKVFLPKGRLQPSWAWFWEWRQYFTHRQSVQSKGLQNPLIWSKIGIWEAKKRVVRTKKFSEFFVFTFLIPYFHTWPCLFLAQRGFVYFLCQ